MKRSTRNGFIAPREFSRFTKAIEKESPAVADLARWLYLMGWKISEAKALTWSDVDLAAGTVHLPAQGGLRRQVTLPRAAFDLVQRRHGAKRGPYVFHREGECIHDFRRLWLRAARKARQVGLSVHDLRRSFIRNSLDAGLPLKVITTLGGWKTRSVWSYAIVTAKDLARGLAHLSAFMTRSRKGGRP